MIAAAPTRAFDVAVVVHAATAVAAVVVLVVLRSAAGAVRVAGDVGAAAMRSFTGRREIAGRVVHLVPLSGLWVVAASRGANSLTEPFVVAGIALWLAAAVALEAVAFPAQRRCAAALSSARRGDAVQLARRMAAGVTVGLAALVVAAAVMVAAQSA